MAADYVKLGGLVISASPYFIESHDFLEAASERVYRQRASGYGEALVSERRKNSVHAIVIHAKNQNTAAVQTNIRAIQAELNKLNLGQTLVVEYIPEGGANSNFIDVVAHNRQTPLDWRYLTRNHVIVTLTLDCDPYWRANEVTSLNSVSLGNTPAQIVIDSPAGEVPAPTRTWLDLSAFTAVFVAISRKNLTLIRDLSGTVEAGTLGGQFFRQTGVNNAAFVNADNSGWQSLDVQDYRGNYRLLARARTADATPASVQFRARVNRPPALATWDWVGTTYQPFSGASWTWCDLGSITFPPTVTNLDSTASVDLKLEAKGSSGTGYNFDLDCVVLLPEPAMSYQLPTAGAGRMLFDGYHHPNHIEPVYSGSLGTIDSIGYWPPYGVGIGTFPRVYPGQDNSLIVVGTGTSLVTCTAMVKHRPLYESPEA